MLNSLSRRVGYVYRFERHTTRRPKNCTGTNIGRDVRFCLYFLGIVVYPTHGSFVKNY
jgi:hypothetical protein